MIWRVRMVMARAATCLLAATIALSYARGAAAAAAPIKFVDCQCLVIGNYVLPAQAVPALPADGLTGVSPGGKYSVSAQPGLVQAAAITVTRMADGAVLLNHVEAADWGFSPDDDRFVVALKSVGGAPAMAMLYDLTAVPAAKLAELTLSAAGSAISFSPHGAWLLDVELEPTPTSVAMQVLDARTGTRVHQDSFNFTQAPGLPGAELGAVAVGFGPDTYDRTLTYAYLTGPSSSQWTAVNLMTGALVVNQQPGPAFSWGFSPCGDVIGIVDDQEPAALKDAEVYATLDPDHLGGSGTFPATDDASLSVDVSNHRVTHNTTTVALAPNTAMASCPAPPANTPPVAAFSAPVSSLSLLAVQFTDHSTDADGRVVSWAWDFGDGQFSALRNPTHVFLAAGNFAVRLTVTDDGGATDSVSHSITVTANHPPHAAFTFTPSPPAAHDVVTFTDQSTDDDDGVATLDWSIDGISYSGSVVHARACPPSMNVTLTATDHGGQSDQITQVIPVTGGNGDVHVPAGSDLATASAAACPGDRLVLDAGHYTGGVTLPATISMKGAGMGATFIEGYGNDPDKWVLRLPPDLTVSDLTVSGGGTSAPAASLIGAGGGILVFASGPSRAGTTLSAVEVTANQGNGGIWITDQVSAVTISRSSIHDNQNVMGGSSAIGMSCCAAVAIDHTAIAHNTGGRTTVSIWEADGLSFVANDVHDNDSLALAVQVSPGPGTESRHVLLSRFAGNGGGIVTDIELLFAGNLVVRNGGDGITGGHAAELTIVNSTVADNAGVGIGAGIVVWNTIVAGNGTDLGGALGGGGSNLIGGTPGFVGSGDYHLAPGSPAIDTGDNAAVPALLVTDADGDPRILNGGSGTARVDIGWDEAVSGSPSQDGGTDAGPSDAGTAEDAGSLDAGTGDAGPGDAGLPDAGSSDAGQDGGVSGGSDAGAGGTGNGGRSRGGCSSTSGGALVWIAVAAWLFERRRRSSSSAERRRV